MDSTMDQNADGASAFRPFTKAERIQQLNSIDKSITQLLQSAGLALRTLSTSHIQEEPHVPISGRREAFETICNSYLRTLQTVDVGLHRQIYGLEEAAIIPADKVKKTADGASGLNPPGAPKSAVTQDQVVSESGIGKLDIGFLNSKSGRVGRDMEAELWKQTKDFLEGLDGSGAGDGEAEPIELDDDVTKDHK